MKCRLVSVLLALCVAAGAQAAPFSALQVQAAQDGAQPQESENNAENVQGDYQYKILEDGTAEISRYTGADAAVSIPDQMDGRQVTGIGAGAFRGCSALEITIPQGTVNIGNGAFSECEKLQKISVPDSVKSIGSSAFMHCSSLESFDIPDGVSVIDAYTFAYCEKLAQVSIPDSVTEMKEAAFGLCKSLKSVIIPKGAVSIPEYAFLLCESLEEITIPEGVTYIGEEAFSSCTGLKKLVLADSVKTIDWSAFANCASLSSVRFPKKLEIISEEAFNGCSSLKSVTLSEGVWRIGEAAFNGCSSLEKITLPLSTKEIAAKAFNGCAKLKKVSYAGSKTKRGKIRIQGSGNQNLLKAVIHYGSSGKSEVLAPKKGTRLKSGKETYQVKTDVSTLAFVKTASKDTKITVPDSVVIDGIVYTTASVTKDAFKNNKKITKVTIRGPITSIGKNAFSGCSRLGTIVIQSDDLQTVGANAFKGIKSTAAIKIRLGNGAKYKKLMKGKGQGSKVKITEY